MCQVQVIWEYQGLFLSLSVQLETPPSPRLPHDTSQLRVCTVTGQAYDNMICLCQLCDSKSCNANHMNRTLPIVDVVVNGGAVSVVAGVTVVINGDAAWMRV